MFRLALHRSQILSALELLALSLLFTGIGVLYLWLVTYGTGNLFRNELRGSAFQYVGYALLEGRVDVPCKSLDNEAIRIGDKCFMYFGVFPGIFRLGTEVLLPWTNGNLSRFSCYAAALLCLAAATLLFEAALQENSRLTRVQRTAGLSVLVFGFSLGTPIIFILSCAYIYHEAIIWGLALSLLTLTILQRSKGYLGLFVASLLAVCALHSRFTFGVGAAVLCCVSSFSLMQRNRTRWILALSPLFLGVLAQLWLNKARFGDPLMLWDFVHTGDFRVASFRGPLIAYGPYNLARIPDAVSNYLGFRFPIALHAAPYFLPRSVFMKRPLLFNFQGDYREWIVPLPFSATWLLVTALCGFCVLCRRPRHEQIACWARVTALASPLLILIGFSWITQRYIVEFLPVLVYLTVIAARFIRPPTNNWAAVTSLFGLLLLCVFSVVVNWTTALGWNICQNWAVDESVKTGLYDTIAPAWQPIPVCKSSQAGKDL